MRNWQRRKRRSPDVRAPDADNDSLRVQLGRAFPLSGHLSGFLQLFSGYWQSLIDYNYSQKAIGAGVMLNQ
jgi:outer membrane phospholipase A